MEELTIDTCLPLERLAHDTARFNAAMRAVLRGRARALRARSAAEELRHSRVPLRVVALFARQMSVMLAAGVTASRALTVLEAQPEAPVFGRIVGRINADIQAGNTLSHAFGMFQHVFSPVFVSAIRVGETHGDLCVAFSNLAHMLEKSERLMRRVKAALTYPLTTLAIALGVTLLLFNRLVPQFIVMFKQMHLHLPWITRVVSTLVSLLQDPLAIGVFMVGVAGAVWWYRRVVATPSGRVWSEELIRCIPLFKELFDKLAVSRMARTLSVLLAAGVTMTEALAQAGDACGSEILRQDINRSLVQIARGADLASGVRSDLFEPLVTHMIRTGEETGKLDIMMAKLASYYEPVVDDRLASMQVVLEPIITTLLGVLIGGVCLSIFLPLYGIVGKMN
jgi:type IV pilus assembly protein PilC